MTSNTSVPDECWLTSAAEVRGSPIAGLGLFAVRDIVMGEPVMRLGGRIIGNDDLAGLTPPYSSLCIGEDAHILIDPTHPVRYGNHSCDPNLWHEDATTVVARRHIRDGEELTIDYATHTISPNWSMPCRCGSSLCRGSVSGNDWRLPDLQARYGSHWTPPLNTAIADALAKPPGLVRSLFLEVAYRHEARRLLRQIASEPDRFADVGLNFFEVRDDIRRAQKSSSPLGRYLARLLGRGRRTGADGP